MLTGLHRYGYGGVAFMVVMAATTAVSIVIRVFVDRSDLSVYFVGPSMSKKEETINDGRCGVGAGGDCGDGVGSHCLRWQT